MAGIGLAGPEAVVDPSSLLTDGSGFGRTMSAESVLDYTQIKTVVINA